MKLNRCLCIAFAGICICGLVLSIVFELNSCQFWSNVFIGVFSSSLLAFATALISYLVTRQEALLSYLGALQAYAARLRQLKQHYFLDEDLAASYESLECYFYDMHYNAYLKIQSLFTEGPFAKELNKAFEYASFVRENIRPGVELTSHVLEQAEEKLNSAINIVKAKTKNESMKNKTTA